MYRQSQLLNFILSAILFKFKDVVDITMARFRPYFSYSRKRNRPYADKLRIPGQYV